MTENTYTELPNEGLTKEALLKDQGFLSDAYDFLTEREGLDLQSPEEVYDAYLEHFRFQNSNEVTSILDMEYAQDADVPSKQRLARLMDTFDRRPDSSINPFTEEGRQTWGDYGESIIKAPSTYASILTGGIGKGASFAGTQAAKLALKEYLKNFAKGAVIGGATDASIGAGLEATNQQTEKELGLRDETDLGEVALSGALSGAPGTVLGGANRALQGSRMHKANQYADAFTERQKTLAKEANEKADAIEKANPEAFAEAEEAIKSQLPPLNPDDVAKGEKLIEGLTEQADPALANRLSPDTIKRVAAAAVEVKDKLDIKPNTRISTTIADGLRDGVISPAEVTDIYRRFNVTPEEFNYIFLHEMSEAGKTLNIASQTKKAFYKNEAENVISSIRELNTAGLAEVNDGQLLELTKSNIVMRDLINKAGSVAKVADKFRLGMMTSQLATAMRNTANGIMRLGVDVSDRLFYNLTTSVKTGKFKNPLSGVASTIGALADPKIARTVQDLLGEVAPTQAKQTFRALADIEAYTGSGVVENSVIKLARAANIANWFSDNMFKRSVITSSIRRQLADQGQNLNDILRAGKFDTIPQSVFDKAFDDAMHFTYQYSPKGHNIFSKAAKGVIKAHHKYPFIISSIIPFPRFIANSMQFLYEHAPLIGMIPLDNVGAKAANKVSTLTSDRIAKQFTGAMMLSAAVMYRNEINGKGYKWYEFEDPNGERVDGRAMMGPFAPIFLLADWISRSETAVGSDEVSLQAEADTYTRDLVQAMSGSTFRVGTGLYMLDEAIELWTSDDELAEDKLSQSIARLLGDTINTFTLPANQFQDIFSQFNPEMRVAKETRDVNFWQYLKNRAGRSTQFGDTEHLPDSASPTHGGKLKRRHPIIKQISGLTYSPKKTPIEAELDRLQITPYELMPPTGDAQVDLLAKKLLGERLDLIGPLFINKPEYQNIDKLELKGDRPFQSIKEIDGRKRYLLKKAIKEFANEAKDRAIKANGYRVEYRRLPARLREQVNTVARDKYGMNIFELAEITPTAWSIGLDIASGLK